MLIRWVKCLNFTLFTVLITCRVNVISEGGRSERAGLVEREGAELAGRQIADDFGFWRGWLLQIQRLIMQQLQRTLVPRTFLASKLLTILATLFSVKVWDCTNFRFNAKNFVSQWHRCCWRTRNFSALCLLVCTTNVLRVIKLDQNLILVFFKCSVKLTFLSNSF